jgi:hypothetical protein
VLGGAAEEGAAPSGEVATSAAPQVEPAAAPGEDRLDRIERELGELREELARLREALGEG